MVEENEIESGIIFITFVDALRGVLLYPSALCECAGLGLVKLIHEDPANVEAIKACLIKIQLTSPEAEVAALLTEERVKVAYPREPKPMTQFKATFDLKDGNMKLTREGVDKGLEQVAESALEVKTIIFNPWHFFSYSKKHIPYAFDS